jgi:hypothetical protein
MRSSGVWLVCLVLMLAACAARPDPGQAASADGLTWSEAADRLVDDGFADWTGLRRVGDGCWRAEAELVGMRTEIYLDRSGRLSEWRPGDCRRGPDAAEVAGLR